jgi:hypothetical protein
MSWLAIPQIMVALNLDFVEVLSDFFPRRGPQPLVRGPADQAIWAICLAQRDKSPKTRGSAHYF